MVSFEFRDGRFEHEIRRPTLDHQHAPRNRVSDRQEGVYFAGGQEKQGSETES
jgi:hypothetical protein